MSDSGFTFKVNNWFGGIVVVGIIVLAFMGHNYRFYHNPQSDELIRALESDDLSVIGEALYASGKLTMGTGHKLIAYILPHLSDPRQLPEDLRMKIVRDIQSTPGAILGIEEQLEDLQTVGFAAALTLQSLFINDLETRRWMRGKYQDRIVEYVMDNISPYGDEESLKNGLWAVNQIHDKRLIPYWSECLEIESESVRIPALAGLFYYIRDRTNGLYTWHPEKEIDERMINNLKLCIDGGTEFVRIQASYVVKMLNEAGLDVRR